MGAQQTRQCHAAAQQLKHPLPEDPCCGRCSAVASCRADADMHVWRHCRCVLAGNTVDRKAELPACAVQRCSIATAPARLHSNSLLMCSSSLPDAPRKEQRLAAMRVSRFWCDADHLQYRAKQAGSHLARRSTMQWLSATLHKQSRRDNLIHAWTSQPTQSTSSHICCKHEWMAPSLELCQHPIAFLLALVPMEC